METPVEITVTNRLIAEFMGCTRLHMTDDYEVTAFMKKLGTIRRFSNVQRLKFHRNWNWLMPVVEKIENTTHNRFAPYVTITNYNCEIEIGKGESQVDICVGISNSKLSAVYRAVILYIEWYNPQIKK